MPNNFEKQVKEKMDELTFVPTAPVWGQIEKQIRAKKDRRRFLLWLPLFILFTGIGTWLLKNGLTNKVEQNTVALQIDKVKKEAPVQNNNGENIPAMEQRQENKSAPYSQGPLIYKSQKITDKEASVNIYSTKLKRVNGKEDGNENKGVVIKRTGVQATNNLLKDEQGIDPSESELESSPPVPYIQERLLNNPGFTLWIDSSKARQVVPDSVIFIDSLIVKAKPILSSHWQIGINGSIGFSGISKSFDVFPNALQADVGSVSGSYNSNGYRSSQVNKNIAYSVGAQFKKELSQRVAFAFGIGYRYYSTAIKVGQERLQDTVLGANKSVNRYYLGYGPNLQNYSNQYHFISLPVSLEWKIGTHWPIYLEGSVSINQMIHTNGLVFDGRTGIYYHDRSAYDRTQLMTGLGLSYELLRSVLFIGPQAQFGIRRMEKNGSSNHLVYAGLQAHYFFKK